MNKKINNINININNIKIDNLNKNIGNYAKIIKIKGY